MIVTKTILEGCLILEPKVFKDSRGYFLESFNQALFNEITGRNINFVQDNESKSYYGVLRGLHIQRGEFAQAKLVRVIDGSVIDVALDVRKGSPTFGQHVAVELSAKNKKQLFIPRGFLHGFSVISESVTFSYKCDNYYDKASEDGVYPLDEELNIDWGLPKDKIVLSDKDNNAQRFNAFNPF